MTTHIDFRDLGVRYGSTVALREITFGIPKNAITAIVGPASSGKTTLLKCINRTIDFVGDARISGDLLIDGVSVVKMRDVLSLRRRVGMVFPLPVGLPLSVYENVAYAPRRRGMRKKPELDELVERCLRQSALWDEVKDRLNMLGTKLSGGQQQRLTLARALSLEPEILCLDEFSIAIDPVTTMRIEAVLAELKAHMTIVMVTNLVQQARRLADQLVFLNASQLIEYGSAPEMFDQPKEQLSAQYLGGEIG